MELGERVPMYSYTTKQLESRLGIAKIANKQMFHAKMAKSKISFCNKHKSSQLYFYLFNL